MEESNTKFLETIKSKIVKLVPTKIVGIYLHGSLATNFFDWEKSDINILIVINKELNDEEKINLLNAIYELDCLGPKRGLDITFVLEKHIKSTIYPIPFCLRYSKAHKELFLKDKKTYALKMNGYSKKIVIALMNIFYRGKTLYGINIKNEFKEPNTIHYIDALFNIIKYANEEIVDDPLFYVLSLVRTYVFLKKNILISKGEAIYYMREYMHPIHTELVNKIGRMFLNNEIIKIDEKELKSFGSFLLNEIKSEVDKKRFKNSKTEV